MSWMFTVLLVVQILSSLSIISLVLLQQGGHLGVVNGKCGMHHRLLDPFFLALGQFEKPGNLRQEYETPVFCEGTNKIAQNLVIIFA